MRSEVSDGLIPCAFGVKILVASGDSDNNLFSIAFVAESDIVVQELSPRPKKHCEVEFVGNNFVVFKFGDGLTQEARIGQILERDVFAILVPCGGLPLDVGVRFPPVGMLLIVVAPIDVPDDGSEFEKAVDVDGGLAVFLYEEGRGRGEE